MMDSYELAQALLKMEEPFPVYYYHPEFMSAFLVNSLDVVDGKVYLRMSRGQDDETPVSAEVKG
jgi:hypothetical protein